MQRCPSDLQLWQFLEEALGEVDRDAVESHLDAEPRCDRCHGRLDAMTRGDLAALVLAASPPPESGGPAADPPAGEVGLPEIPGYTVLREQGRGGMGVVYEAMDDRLGRRVAIKRIHPHLLGSPNARRFDVEAPAVARLKHPNIVAIHRIDEEGGTPFLVMEQVDGGNLAAVIAAGPMPVREAARLLALLAGAIHHAHEQGVIHRDLKPSNILMTTGGQPLVADFGMAKILDATAAARLTATGQAIGTPAYMAPEQVRSAVELEGGPADAGPAIDVYALGVILYEMLAGRVPFRGATPIDTVSAVLNAEPIRPTRLVSGVPRDLETICLKCLDKDPARRYRTAVDLAADLDRWLRGEPILARPTSLIGRVSRWARRRPAVAALLAFSALVALAGGLGVLFQWRATVAALREVGRERDHASAISADLKVALDESRRLGDLARAGGEKLARSLDRELQSGYVANIGAAQAAARKGELARLREFLDVPEQAGLRGFEWHYLDRIGGLGQVTLRGHEKTVSAVAYRGDGRRLASVDPAGTVRIWDPAAPALPVLSIGGLKNPITAAFSPDGKLVAIGGSAFLGTWDAETGRPARAVPMNNPLVYATAVAFADDGMLAAAGTDGFLMVWNPLDDAPPRMIRPHSNINHVRPHPLAVSCDGRNLAATADFEQFEPREVGIWDIATGRETRRLKGHDGPPRALAFDRAGARLISGDGGGRARVWKVDDGQPEMNLWGHQGGVRAAAFVPETGRILTGGGDGTLRSWDAGDGRPLGLILAHDEAVNALAVRPDGLSMATGSNDLTVRIWGGDQAGTTDIRIGPPSDVTIQSGAMAVAAFHPDGRRLASGIWLQLAGVDLKGTPTIRIIDAATGADATALEPSPWAIPPVAFSPDGSRILAASRHQDLAAIAWDAATGRLLPPIVGGDSAPLRRAAFTPDGSRVVATSARDTVESWDSATGHPAPSHRLAAPQEGGRIAAGPGGLRIVDGGRVHDLASGHSWPLPPGAIERPDYPNAVVAFDADGFRIVLAERSGGDDPGRIEGSDSRVLIRIRRASDGVALARLGGHRRAITALALSRDGRRLASGDEAGTIRIWDVGLGRELIALDGPERAVLHLGFDRDGRRLASVTDNGIVRIWNPPVN